MMEKGCSNMGGKVCGAAPLLIFLISVLLPLASAADIPSDASTGQSLTLNVYLDGSGKALITGYAESITGLDFLEGSQFQLENDSHQLYALTAGLTTKEGDLWTLHFDSSGDFNDYRVTFYLPSETSLGKINISQGLSYLLSASNESLVADVQGWDLSDPRISIQYRQPLASDGNSQLPPPPGYPGEGTALIVLIIAAALMIAGFGLAVFLQRKRHSPHERALPAAIKPAGGDMDYEAGADSGEKEAAVQSEEAPGRMESAPSPSPAQAPLTQQVSDPPDSSSGDMAIIRDEEEDPSDPTESDPDDASSTAPTPPSDSGAPSPSQEYASIPASPLSQDSERDEDAAAQPSQEGSAASPPEKKIAVTSEMEAVMQTLTARENAVMNTLISHGGRMTQAEIRYETGTPKSSLTGILISLERRKLVIKKEWGRTNIIELSDWFLSKKEHS